LTIARGNRKKVIKPTHRAIFGGGRKHAFGTKALAKRRRVAADPSFSPQVRVDPEIGTVVWPNGFDMRLTRC